jgi:hypothetical protein
MSIRGEDLVGTIIGMWESVSIRHQKPHSEKRTSQDLAQAVIRLSFGRPGDMELPERTTLDF